MRKEFTKSLLNVTGCEKMNAAAEVLSGALDKLEEIAGADGREMALVRTKLEEAGFYVTRSIALRPENQGAPQSGKIENAMDAMDYELTQIKNLLSSAGIEDNDGAGGYVGPAQRLRMLLDRSAPPPAPTS